MYIQKLVLNNFQQHSHLELNFSPGVNYLVGKTDCGKSTIRRAISFLFFNSPRTDDIRKEGTKTTSVIVTLDNGTDVERVKSASINRYIVRVPGKEELVYDSIGSAIPADVKTILQVSTVEIDKDELNLNIAEQITLPFLMDKSASFRLKLFNKITGNDVLDQLIQNMNKEILLFGREIKTAQEFINTNESNRLTINQQIVKETHLLEITKKSKDLLIGLYDRYKKLKELDTRVTTLQNTKKEVNTLLKGVKLAPDSLITELRGLIDRYTCLSQIQASKERIMKNKMTIKENLGCIHTISDDKIKNINNSIQRQIGLEDLNEAYKENKLSSEKLKKELMSIKVVDLSRSNIMATIKKHDSLLSLWNRYSKQLALKQSTISSMNGVRDHVKILDKQYIDLLKEAKFCPVCKQSTENCC